jgi:phosphoglycerate kinase
MMQKAREKGVRLMLPTDVMSCQQIEANAPCKIIPANQIPGGWVIADIGPETSIKSRRKSKKERPFLNGPWECLK